MNLTSFLPKIPEKFASIVLVIIAISISIPVIKEIFKSTSISKFDQLFISKDQNKWHKVVSFAGHILLFVIGSFCSSLLLWFSSKPYMILVQMVILLSIGLIVFTVIATFIQFLRMRVISKLRILIKAKPKPFGEFLLPMGLIFIYVIYIAYMVYFINQISLQLLNTTEMLVYSSIFICAPIFILLTYRKIYKFALMLDEPDSELFKMSIPNQDEIKTQELFFLHSLDANHFVLGDRISEDTSTTLYLYDKENDRYIKFSKTKNEPETKTEIP